MRIVRYHVVEEPTLPRLMEKVEKFIAMGWQPLGGVSPGTATDGYTSDFIQAVVLYEDN